MERKGIPFRQIHLDFHTSPMIGEIGAEFDAEEFAETLKKAHVNSINLFTKCHHGMFYYPTVTFPSVGRSTLPRICSRVDFPEPEAPTIAANSPFSTDRSIPLRAAV